MTRDSDDLDLVRALRLTADPPQGWIEAAVQIPATLGDLERLETVIDEPAFRRRFADDARAALTGAGLPATASMVSAVRDRLAL